MSDDGVPQRVTMICTPVDEPGTPGSSRRRADCGHQVWLSAGGAAAVASRGGAVSLQCTRCVTMSPSDRVWVPPEVHAELAGLLGRGRADAIAKSVIADPVFTAIVLGVNVETEGPAG